MTIGMGTTYDGTPEVDFFSLHSRKQKHIDVQMLDYDYVGKCSDVDELKGILAMLRSGKEGRYPHLEKTTEDRILAVLPVHERNKIIRMRSGPTAGEANEEQEELSSWTQRIDQTNRALQEGGRHGARRLPPVRGQTTASEPTSTPLITEVTAKSKSTATATATATSSAIPAYDFRAWEKYDVEKAIAEIDSEEKKHQDQAQKQREQRERRSKERLKELSSLPSYVDINALSHEERLVHALHEKQKGNESFKVGENDEAILFYTRSMAFDDSSAIIYANRAMAHLRLKNFAQAEDDCSRAIHLDDTYCKAWTRRGMTRFRRGKYGDAVEDFKRALTLEPGSKEIERLLNKTLAKWKEMDGTVEASNQGKNDAPRHGHAPSVVMSAEKDIQPPPLFKRFEIIEDESGDEEDEDDDANDPCRSQTTESPFQRFEIIED